MDKIISGLGIIFLVIIVAVVAIAALGFDVGIGGGYEVTVNGNINRDSELLGGAWTCTYYDCDVKDDPGLFQLNPAWFWDTWSILVEVEITDGFNDYDSSEELGTINKVSGGNKDFHVSLRHVEPGIYSGYITVYELEKSLFGYGWETGRKEVAHNDFTVDVGIEG